jgi:hypothetical protein
VDNGVADFAFCILGPVSSQFPKTLVATLPFEAESAREAVIANWVKTTPDGAHVLAAFRKEIAAIRAGS